MSFPLQSFRYCPQWVESRRYRQVPSYVGQLPLRRVGQALAMKNEVFTAACVRHVRPFELVGIVDHHSIPKNARGRLNFDAVDTPVERRFWLFIVAESLVS
jgi:hypothetical protein